VEQNNCGEAGEFEQKRRQQAEGSGNFAAALFCFSGAEYDFQKVRYRHQKRMPLFYYTCKSVRYNHWVGQGTGQSRTNWKIVNPPIE